MVHGYGIYICEYFFKVIVNGEWFIGLYTYPIHRGLSWSIYGNPYWNNTKRRQRVWNTDQVELEEPISWHEVETSKQISVDISFCLAIVDICWTLIFILSGSVSCFDFIFTVWSWKPPQVQASITSTSSSFPWHIAVLFFIWWVSMIANRMIVVQSLRELIWGTLSRSF